MSRNLNRIQVILKLTSDFYQMIHEKCVFSKQTFNDAQIRLINRVLTNDGIVTTSPFIAKK
jgi:hypothetical protein